MKNTKYSHYVKRISATLISFWFLLMGLMVVFRYFDPDEFEHLHAARSIYYGMIPYKDFFQHHPPLFYFLLAQIYSILPDKIALLFLGRLFMLFLTILSVYLTYHLAKRLYGKKVALFSTFLLMNVKMFQEKAIEIRPDILALVLWLYLLNLVVEATGVTKGSKNKSEAKIQQTFIMGVLTATLILTTQKIIFGLLGLLAYYLYSTFSRYKNCISKKTCINILCYLFGFLVPIVFVSFYFSINNSFKEFSVHCFLLPLKWKSETSSLRYLFLPAKQNPVYSILALAGIFYVIFTQKNNKLKNTGVLMFSALFLLIGLFIIPVPHMQYYLYSLPLYGIYAGLALNKVWEFMRNQKKFVAVLITFIFLNSITHTLQYFNSDKSNTHQVKEIQYILDNTDLQDNIFDGWSGVGVFRNHAYYYYYLHPGVRQIMAPIQLSSNILKVFQEKKPKIIIYDSDVKKLSNEVRSYIEINYKYSSIGDIHIRNSD